MQYRPVQRLALLKTCGQVYTDAIDLFYSSWVCTMSSTTDSVNAHILTAKHGLPAFCVFLRHILIPDCRQWNKKLTRKYQQVFHIDDLDTLISLTRTIVPYRLARIKILQLCFENCWPSSVKGDLNKRPHQRRDLEHCSQQVDWPQGTRFQQHLSTHSCRTAIRHCRI